MGKRSIREGKNEYQLAREELELSRLEAADKIAEIDNGMYNYLDENRLAKIEYESTKIQPDDIVALSKAYNKPELRNYYCCHQCPIGEIDAPEVTYKSGVHEILVNMAVALKTVNHNKIRLMEILEDGKVSADEAGDFNDISEQLEHISMTIEALQLWCEKMKIERK